MWCLDDAIWLCLCFCPVSLVLQYLGSMLIKELRGTESTQDACAKMRVGAHRVFGQWELKVSWHWDCYYVLERAASSTVREKMPPMRVLYRTLAQKKDSFIKYSLRLTRSVRKVENLASSRFCVCERQTADLHFMGCSDKQPCLSEF